MIKKRCNRPTIRSHNVSTVSSATVSERWLPTPTTLDFLVVVCRTSSDGGNRIQPAIILPIQTYSQWTTLARLELEAFSISVC